MRSWRVSLGFSFLPREEALKFEPPQTLLLEFICEVELGLENYLLQIPGMTFEYSNEGSQYGYSGVGGG